MTPFLTPGTRVTVLCPHRKARLPRVVEEHLTVGPRAGWVRLRKPDGSVEHRTADTLMVEVPEEEFLSSHLEFYSRDEGQVLERLPLSGTVGQLTCVRAEVARAFRVPEHRIGVRVAT